MTTVKPERRSLFWFVLIFGIAAGVGVAHCIYYLRAKAGIAHDAAATGTPEATYHINYWHIPHYQALLYGVLGGVIAGAVIGWTLDAIRADRFRFSMRALLIGIVILSLLCWLVKAYGA